jgi:phytoene dehydrogenase-like protein
MKLPQPIKLADQVYKYLLVSNYAGDAAYSPKGKTALTVQLPGDTYDFWKKAKEENRYAEEKQKLAGEFIAAIEMSMSEARGQVEVVDVATPLTYERYCGNWKGSWMTMISSDLKFKTYPSVINGLSGIYFAGHRMMPPGGLPPALMSGRMAVLYLCRDTGTTFVSEE